VALHVDDQDVQRRRPVWRFADLDEEGSWPLSSIANGQLRQLLEKLQHFETMTLGELFSPSSVGKKYAVEDLPGQARTRLIDIGKDDETQVVRLRCGGRERLFGILREHVFHVLWWDPEHEVFPSKKKHT
jgi:hypothetical protein